MNRQPEGLKAKASGDEAVVTLLRIFGNAGFKVLRLPILLDDDFYQYIPPVAIAICTTLAFQA